MGGAKLYRSQTTRVKASVQPLFASGPHFHLQVRDTNLDPARARTGADSGPISAYYATVSIESLLTINLLHISRGAPSPSSIIEKSRRALTEEIYQKATMPMNKSAREVVTYRILKKTESK